jgi:hypothetical protein
MITQIELSIGGTNMKFLKSTRSKVLAAVAAIMALSASAAYSTDCYSYCDAQARAAGENAKQQILTNYMSYCYQQGSGQQNCMNSVNAASDQAYASAYSQAMNQCMGQCH